ncbi:MAG TPA: MxaK protein [Methylocella sp.]|nr:MxaK protein [Methylocella sp.]
MKRRTEEAYSLRFIAAQKALHLQQSLVNFGRRIRSLTLVLALVGSALATAYSAYLWLNTQAANKTIQDLTAGHDIQVDSTDAPEVVLARITCLARRDDTDTPRLLIDALERRGETELAAKAHYNLANALLRKAFVALEKGDLEAAGPFVNLSRREYRHTLALRSDFWDAKFNFDVASRLLREYPELDRTSGDELLADPKKIWTDIPGLPKGLP